MKGVIFNHSHDLSVMGFLFSGSHDDTNNINNNKWFIHFEFVIRNQLMTPDNFLVGRRFCFQLPVQTQLLSVGEGCVDSGRCQQNCHLFSPFSCAFCAICQMTYSLCFIQYLQNGILLISFYWTINRLLQWDKFLSSLPL